MRSIYKKLLIISAILILFIIIMIIVSPYVYKLWVGDSVDVPFIISVLIGIYNILLIISNMHSAILNGMGKVRLQVIQAIVQAVLYIPLVILLGKYHNIVGILIALIISAIVPVVILSIQVNLVLNQKAKDIWNQ